MVDTFAQGYPGTGPKKVADLLLSNRAAGQAAVALVCAGRRWTYGDLLRCTSASRAILEEAGVGRGDRVAIVGMNDFVYVAAYFAVQCLGGVSLEIVRHESLSTLHEILARTGPQYVITDRKDLEEALDGEISVRSFTGFLAEVESRCGLVEELEAVEVGWDDPASIIYTSGTTGLPKGVVLSNGNFCSVVGAVVEYLQLGPEDQYALALPLSHSYGKSNLLTCVAVGARAVLLNNFHDLPAFLGDLERERCTVFSGVPYHANLMVRKGDLGAFDLSSLRAMTFSGNHLPSETVDRLNEMLPELRIYSMYGLTESTTRACYVPPERLAEKRNSCGWPIRCTRLRIVGEDGSLLPPRNVGNVELQGTNIMLGYLDEPELTAQTLVDGWLRTGDLGWVDDEGFLYLVGREKDIIKCAGERISPQEIEAVLCSHPEVEEAAVVGVPDRVLGEVVKAYIVAKPGSVDIVALRSLCARSLSHHKIPRHYEFVDSLPKTVTGKVKKNQLRGV